jgi:hypothetical protein
MDVCVCVFLCCVVLCVGRGLALDWSPNQGVLPNICGSRSPLRKAKGPHNKDCRSQLKKKIKSVNISMGRTCSIIRYIRNACKILFAKPQNKGLFRRPSRIYEGNIKTGFRRIVFELVWTNSG